MSSLYVNYTDGFKAGNIYFVYCGIYLFSNLIMTSECSESFMNVSLICSSWPYQICVSYSPVSAYDAVVALI